MTCRVTPSSPLARFAPRVALGMAAGSHQAALKAWLARYRWVILAVAVSLVPLGMLEWEVLLSRSGQNWLDPTVTVLDAVYAAAVLLNLGVIGS